MSKDFIEEEEQDFHLQTYIRRYLRYWYLFPIFIALALIAAFFYLQITQPVYSAKTSILIKDEKRAWVVRREICFRN